MFVKFKTIRYKNLLAVGNSFIEIYLDRNDKTLIYGENGSGKSTVLDALSFVLFKKAFREVNKPLLVNTITGEQCVVEVEFEVGSTEYLIRRGIKPEIFEIYQNGKMLDQQNGVIDYQDILEKQILKFNFKTFKQIMVLGSKSFVPFMKLTASERRSVIEELLDIQIFSAMAKVTRNKLDSVRDRLNDHERNVQVLQEKTDLLTASLQSNVDQHKAKIELNQISMLEHYGFIKDLKLDISMDEVGIEKLHKVTNQLSGIQNHLDRLTKLQTQISTNKNKIHKDALFFKDNNTCPTCKQSIEAHFRTTQVITCTEKELELAQGLIDLEKIIEETKAKLQAVNDALNQIMQLQSNIQFTQQKIKNLEDWNKKLQEEIISLQLSTKAIGSNEQLNQFINEKDNLINLINSLKIEKRHLEAIALMLKDGGIKASIIKQYLPIMNNFINKYLSFMDFSANFTLNETFEESIMARHRDKFAYESFSDGQKLRIDLALLFAWRAVAKVKNSVDTNILIMDEIIDSSLDNAGIDDFFKLISSFKETNIFIISPKGDVLVDKFENTIKFALVNSFTEIV